MLLCGWLNVQLGYAVMFLFAVVCQVVADRNHTLQGKTIDPKRAQARGGAEGCRKVFVGGLDPNLTEEKIREYFGRYGKVSLNFR